MDTVVPLLTARPKLLFFTDLRPWPSVGEINPTQSIMGWRPSEPCPHSSFFRMIRRMYGSLGGIEKLAEAGDAQLQFFDGEM